MPRSSSVFRAVRKKTSDYYELKQLAPSYRVFSAPRIARRAAGPAAAGTLRAAGADARQADPTWRSGLQIQGRVGEFLYRDYRRSFDFLNGRMLTEGLKLNVRAS
jgi:hypothetical protein